MKNIVIIVVLIIIILVVIILSTKNCKKKPNHDEGIRVASRVPVKSKEQDYYIIEGVIPEIKPDDHDSKFIWTHAPDLMAKGEDVIVRLNGVWGGFVYPSDVIKEDTKFLRAPTATTYIRKTASNTFLGKPDISYVFMGFTKN